jgi:hypothetical protein
MVFLSQDGRTEGEALGNSISMFISGSSSKLSDAGLHLVLHIVGQKNLTFFPETRSFLLHRRFGFAKTHLAQSLFCSLLNRKVILSVHTRRALDVGDSVGDLDWHVVLQIFGQKYLTFFPVAGSLLLHRLVGFSETHVSQFLSWSLLKRNVLLSSHSPRSSVGEVVGNAVATSMNNSDGDSDGSDVSGIGLTEGADVGFFVGVRVGFFVLISLLFLSLLFSPPFPFPLLFSLLLLFDSLLLLFDSLLLLFESFSELFSLLLLFELMFVLFPLFDSRTLLPIELFLGKNVDPIDGDVLLMMMMIVIIIVVIILSIMILSWLLILLLYHKNNWFCTMTIGGVRLTVTIPGCEKNDCFSSFCLSILRSSFYPSFVFYLNSFQTNRHTYIYIYICFSFILSASSLYFCAKT